MNMVKRGLRDHNNNFRECTDYNGVRSTSDYVLHYACFSDSQNLSLIHKIVEENPSSVQTMVERDYGHLFLGPVQNPSYLKLKDRYGSYPLHIALENGASFGVIRLLTEVSPDVLLKRNKEGRTPLSVAVINNVQSTTIQYLIQKSHYSVGIEDNKKYLPLHHACLTKPSIDVIKNLTLIYPIAAHKVNIDGRTPLDLLKYCPFENDEIVDYLFKVSFPIPVEDVPFFRR